MTKEKTALPAPRPDVMAIAPYVPGLSRLAGRAKPVKLSSNENAFGAPPGALRALREAAAEIHRYPDGGCTLLREALGRRFGLDPDRLVCGAGSDDLIAALCHAYGGPGAELVMSEHGFAMYDICGRIAGCRIVRAPERDLVADVDALLGRVTDATRLLFLTNPNNPTGTLMPAAELRRLRAALPGHVLLVVDAAYGEYVAAPDYDFGLPLVEAGATVVLRTFSKMFGLGGARVGWCYAPPAVVDVLHRVRGPFNVSSASQAAAAAALAEEGWVERCHRHNLEQRGALADRLRAAGLRVIPSEANYILVDFGAAARAAAADAHLKAEGVIVRVVGSYGLPSMLRITIGLAEECEAVGESLERFARLPADA